MDNQPAAPVAAPQPLLCVVNRHQGYPPVSPSYKLGDVCELPDSEQTRDDIKIGYLIPASVEHSLFTPELAKRVVAFQKCKAQSAPVQTSTLPEATAVDEQTARALADQAQQAADAERRNAVAAILNGTGGQKPATQAPATALPDAAVEPAAAIVIAPASGGEESPAADVETVSPSLRKR